MAYKMENEQTIGEWTRHQIILPEDEYDEDDELDARIEQIEKRKRKHITRGGFYGI